MQISFFYILEVIFCHENFSTSFFKIMKPEFAIWFLKHNE